MSKRFDINDYDDDYYEPSVEKFKVKKKTSSNKQFKDKNRSKREMKNTMREMYERYQ